MLVRQRGALFDAIIRALKEADVEVAGADRLMLTEHIAVMDLIALADALLLPHDDLALASVLKSPLFGLTEEQLFALAWKRKGTLRAALRAKARTISTSPPCTSGSSATPHGRGTKRRSASMRASSAPTGAGRASMRGSARRRPTRSTNSSSTRSTYERREAPTLQGFVAWLRAGDTQVKRDMDIARDEVRVMTVHGAKGLEAPIVILADTTTPPKGPREPRLLTLPVANAAPGTPERIVWAGRKADDVAPVAAARARRGRARPRTSIAACSMWR